ncbi:glycosyltransferase family 39 protein [Methylomonas sp. MgM2]
MIKRISSAYWLCLLIVSSIVLTHLIMRSPAYPFSPDSASYIEQARYLVTEGAALSRAYGLGGLGEGDPAAPSSLFPIGFPLVLAFFEFAGVGAGDAAVIVNWISSVIFPFVLYFSFRGSLGQFGAFLVAALSVSSPGFLSYAGMGVTDVFSMLVASISIGLVLNANSKPLMVGAGLLAGVAYSVRNAHVALLVSFVLYFFFMWHADKENRRKAVSNAVVFALGAAVVIVPLFARNLIIFGSINPYEMAPSTIGVTENIRTYLQEFVYDVTAYRELGRIAAWSISGVAILVLIFCLFVWAAFSFRPQLKDKQNRLLLFCSIYLLIGACVVIAARSRYQWGEPINIRHTLQYMPYFMAVCMLFVSVRAKNLLQITVKYSFVFSVVILSILHSLYAAELDSQSRIRYERSAAAASAFQHGKQQLCGAENGALLISNWSFVFRISCNSPVRHWSPVTEGATANSPFSELLLDSLAKLSSDYPNRQIVVGLYPGRDGVSQENLPISGADIAKLRVSGWSTVNNSDRGLLFAR